MSNAQFNSPRERSMILNKECRGQEANQNPRQQSPATMVAAGKTVVKLVLESLHSTIRLYSWKKNNAFALICSKHISHLSVYDTGDFTDNPTGRPSYP